MKSKYYLSIFFKKFSLSIAIFTVLMANLNFITLHAQVMYDNTGTIISASNVTNLTIENYSVPAGDNRIIIAYFSTTNLQGLDADSEDEMGGDYPTLSFAGMNMVIDNAAKREGGTLGVVAYYKLLGSGEAITGNLVADYGTISGDVFLSTATFSNVAQSNTGITSIGGGIGNGANSVGPSVFIDHRVGAQTVASVISDGVPPPVGTDHQFRVVDGIEAGISVATDRGEYTEEECDFPTPPDCEEVMRFTFTGEDDFRQYAISSLGLPCAQNCDAQSLAVQVIDFIAITNQGYVDLAWSLEVDANTLKCTLQHSSDGSHWKDYHTQHLEQRTRQTYQYRHQPISSGEQLYRLVFQHADGTVTYSDTKSAYVADFSEDFVIYPTIAKNNIQYRLTTYQSSQPAILSIFNRYGQLEFKKSLVSNTSGLIPVTSLSAGYYVVQINLEDGSIEYASFIKS